MYHIKYNLVFTNMSHAKYLIFLTKEETSKISFQFKQFRVKPFIDKIIFSEF